MQVLMASVRKLWTLQMMGPVRWLFLETLNLLMERSWPAEWLEWFTNEM